MNDIYSEKDWDRIFLSAIGDSVPSGLLRGPSTTATNNGTSAAPLTLEALVETSKRFKPDPGLLSMKQPMMFYGDGVTDEQAQQVRLELVRRQSVFMPKFAAMEMRRSSVIDRDSLVFIETAPKHMEFIFKPSLPTFDETNYSKWFRADLEARAKHEASRAARRLKEFKARLRQRSYDVKRRGRNRVLHRQRKWMTRGKREILKSAIYHPAMSISITS